MWWIWFIGTSHKTWFLFIAKHLHNLYLSLGGDCCNFNSACSQLVETLDALVAMDALLIQCEPAMLCNFQGIQQKHCLPKYRNAKGRGQLKKNVFFRALPELPKPRPPGPNSGNLVLFSDVKIQDLKVTWGRYINNLKNSSKFNRLAFLKK